MKTISVAVSEEDYEAFRRVARATQRPIAQLIREAMAHYRGQLGAQTSMVDVPVLVGHRPKGDLPARGDLYDEIFKR
ncbi:MAG TPA: ribbon-helix-helix protein, CopG family [Kofleriaceae bacterium]|nr:ribbon-helix-helix protein, CopG family [Kofleriaceae bacterium]